MSSLALELGFLKRSERVKDALPTIDLVELDYFAESRSGPVLLVH